MAAAQTMAMTTTQKIIAIAVTIIIISTVALPVIDDLQEGIIVEDQNVAQSYNMKSTSGNFNVSIVSNVLSVGDYTLTGTGLSYPIMSNSFIVRYMIGDADMYVDLADATYGTKLISVGASSITFTDTNSVSHTISYTGDLLYAAETGTYGYFKNGSDIRFNSDAIFYIPYAFNVSVNGVNNDCSALMKGTADGLSMVFGHCFTQDVSILSCTTSIPYEVNEDEFNEATLGSLTFNVTLSSGSGTYTFTGAVIAPVKYSHIDSEGSFYNLVGVIPVMLILVPLMMAVRMIALKRN